MTEDNLNPVQEKEYCIVGLSRSGNHAVINWLLNQLQEPYLFLNCAEPKTNPFDTARPLNEEGRSFSTNIKDFSLEAEKKAVGPKRQTLLYNYEDCFLGPLGKRAERQKMQEWVGTSAFKKDVLILRDPFNLFASRIKAGLIQGHYTHHGTRPISLLTLRRIYKQHAREFLGKKSILKDKVRINFNRWNSEKEYRKEIAEALEIPFSDEGINEVTGVAGGSSFDGTAYTGKAQNMDLNNRWRNYISDEAYWSLFDSELLELTREIFGEIPAVQYASEERAVEV